MKIKQILEGLTDEQVDQFHTELDDLVHKHLGHSSDEEEQIEEAHQIDWPDKDEDGDSEMERHAYNAINHSMHAYDAFDHVFSMTADHRDWLRANKDEIIKMFAKYGLQTESVEEAVAGPDKCWPGYAPGAQSGVKTKAGTGKNKGKRVNNCEPIKK